MSIIFQTWTHVHGQKKILYVFMFLVTNRYLFSSMGIIVDFGQEPLTALSKTVKLIDIIICTEIVL